MAAKEQPVTPAKSQGHEVLNDTYAMCPHMRCRRCDAKLFKLYTNRVVTIKRGEKVRTIQAHSLVRNAGFCVLCGEVQQLDGQLATLQGVRA